MTKSINDFKTLILAKECLSPTQLFNIKGGDGDDKRRDDDCFRSSGMGTKGTSTPTSSTGTSTGK